MATVKFSKELRDRIVSHAGSLFQVAVNTATQSAPKDWGDKLYEAAFEQYQEKMDALPACFFREWTQVTVSTVVNEENERVASVALTFSLNGSKRVPVRFPAGCIWQNHHYGDSVNIVECEATAPFVAEVKAWRQRIHVAQQQQEEFKRHVRAVIEAYATLAPALKAWEPLWTYIPQDIRDKHMLIVEREKKEPVQIATDLDRATALASLAKMRQQS